MTLEQDIGRFVEIIELHEDTSTYAETYQNGFNKILYNYPICRKDLKHKVLYEQLKYHGHTPEE